MSLAIRVLVGEDAAPGLRGDLLAGSVIARARVVVGDGALMVLEEAAASAFLAINNLYLSAAEVLDADAAAGDAVR